jgi:hypothetical protein
LEELSSDVHRTGDIARLVGYRAALEACGYRQPLLLACSLYKYLRGAERWGHMKRRGLLGPATPSLVAAVPAVR